jgi:hypothetical protein
MELIFPGSRWCPVHRADNRAAILADCLDNVVFLRTHKPLGLHGLLQGYLSEPWLRLCYFHISKTKMSEY